jgi:glucokinase
MPGWDSFPLRDVLAEKFNIPVLIENDANLAAAAERWRGVGTGYDHLAYVKIGTGIGCGLVFEGKIYRGHRGSAGEIGHITITRDGPPCRCGSYGCLESMAASPALINRARLAIEAGRTTTITQYAKVDQLEPQHLAEAARNGDLLAQELINDAGRYIGIALATLINLVNPGLIVLGGGVSLLGDSLLGPIHETVKVRSLVANYQDTQIVIGQLGREAVALGAATLVLQEVFQGPRLAASI